MTGRYIIKEGFAGFRKQPLAMLGSIMTIAISLILLGMFYLLAIQTSHAVDRVRAQVDVEVFLHDPIEKSRLVDLQNQIQKMEGISATEYISKEDAAEFFKQEFGENINKVLDYNPLPPSFKITLKESYRTAQHVQALEKQLMALKGVEDVVYRKDMLEFFDRRLEGFTLIALTLGIFLALSAIILVSHSIRLTIISRKQVIRIMKLVGATRLFIRIPFILEGLIVGMAGGLFAAALLFYFTFSTKELLPMELLSLIQTDIIYYALIVSTGTILGLLGSLFAARTYIGESVL